VEAVVAIGEVGLLVVEDVVGPSERTSSTLSVLVTAVTSAPNDLAI
jgi:hypothetical protein